MDFCNSPAVDALENDFDAFFQYLTKPEEAPHMGGIGGVTPDAGAEVERTGSPSRNVQQRLTNASSRPEKQTAVLHSVDTPEFRLDLANAAAFLLPIAQEHYRMGKWPLEVVAWLMMVSQSLQSKEALQ